MWITLSVSKFTSKNLKEIGQFLNKNMPSEYRNNNLNTTSQKQKTGELI